MVLVVVADTGKVNVHGNVEFLEQPRVADAGQLQQPREVDTPGGEDYFFFGGDRGGGGVAPGRELQLLAGAPCPSA
jgi:hypothetical protein